VRINWLKAMPWQRHGDDFLFLMKEKGLEAEPAFMSLFDG